MESHWTLTAVGQGKQLAKQATSRLMENIASVIVLLAITAHLAPATRFHAREVKSEIQSADKLSVTVSILQLLAATPMLPDHIRVSSLTTYVLLDTNARLEQPPSSRSLALLDSTRISQVKLLAIYAHLAPSAKERLSIQSPVQQVTTASKETSTRPMSTTILSSAQLESMEAK